ncbi:MAG: 23S rRNA (pseudouridine(1915)-N(3))-methyltransferase RlmH [Deltaproteobacteria bacterium]|nr:23S rRNA (pseudouridine(1915)-N(3))-methyltransferase RlmH [Deltaproteobacteria bacterium]
MIGRDKKDPLVLAADEYLDRVRRSFGVEVTELKESPARPSVPIDRTKREEAEKILQAVSKDDPVIALDERGRTLSSIELSQKVGRFANEGRRSIGLIIGGPNGLDASVTARATETWSLSKLTLPHRLARLLLAEQLYRACSILKGEPYHK